VPGQVTDRDLGYNRFVRSMAQLRAATGADDAGVYVGVRADAGNEPDGTPLVQIAAVQEFGSRDGRIPERSYLRSTIDAKQRSYLDALAKAIDRAAMAPFALTTLRRDLDRLGVRAVADVQITITKLRTPPNAPSTIERKGSSNSLIDTGRLRQSIDHEVRIRGGVVGGAE